MSTALDLPIRVLLVDDHEVVRRGIRAALEPDPDFVIAGEARWAREVRDLAAATRPKVVVLDARLADGSGVDLTRELVSVDPGLRVLMLSAFPDEKVLFDSILAGVSGFLLKGSTGKELARAIRIVASGKSLIDPGLTRSVLAHLRSGKRYWQSKPLASLSPKEEQVLDRLGDGRTSRSIGSELHLSEQTVRNYVSSILSKLEVSSRAEGVAYLARQLGEPGP